MNKFTKALFAPNISVDKIREVGRNTQGVMLIRTGEDDLVTSASLLEVTEEEGEE